MSLHDWEGFWAMMLGIFLVGVVLPLIWLGMYAVYKKWIEKWTGHE